MEATSGLLAKIRSFNTFCLVSDTESHSVVCITLRCPVWLEEQQEEPSTQQKWMTDEWSISDVINKSLIEDLTITPSGFV